MQLSLTKMAADMSNQVDMRKVNLTVIRPWIAKKVLELVGFEDDLVVEYAVGLLEDESQPVSLTTLSITQFLTMTYFFFTSCWIHERCRSI